MAQDLLIPFVLLAVLSEITPGPNMGFLALVSARWGWRAGLSTVAGVTAGLALLLALAVAVFAELVTIAPWLFEALRLAGVAYLLWLAFELWRGDFEASPARIGAQPVARRLALRGFVTNLLNPKAAAFYLLILPGFTDPARGEAAWQAVGLGSLHLAISVVVHTAIVLAAAGARPLLQAGSLEHGRDVMRRVLALAMAAIAAWLAWETRG